MKNQEMTRDYAKQVFASFSINWKDRSEIETLQSEAWKLVVSKVVGREINEWYQVNVSSGAGIDTYILEPAGLSVEENIMYQAFVDVCEAQVND